MTQVTELRGTIAAVNEKGVRLQGEDDWRNYSRWRESVDACQKGDRVAIGLDSSGYVRTVTRLEPEPQETHVAAPQSLPALPPDYVDDASIEARSQALRSAVAFAQGRDVSSVDVLKVADVFEQWLMRPGSPDAPRREPRMYSP